MSKHTAEELAALTEDQLIDRHVAAAQSFAIAEPDSDIERDAGDRMDAFGSELHRRLTAMPDPAAEVAAMRKVDHVARSVHRMGLGHRGPLVGVLGELARALEALDAARKV